MSFDTPVPRRRCWEISLRSRCREVSSRSSDLPFWASPMSAAFRLQTPPPWADWGVCFHGGFAGQWWCYVHDVSVAEALHCTALGGSWVASQPTFRQGNIPPLDLVTRVIIPPHKLGWPIHLRRIATDGWWPWYKGFPWRDTVEQAPTKSRTSARRIEARPGCTTPDWSDPSSNKEERKRLLTLLEYLHTADDTMQDIALSMHLLREYRLLAPHMTVAQNVR